jgi:hypothetical protein
MNPANFLIELRDRFPQHLWSPLILAIRQDPIVWHALSQTSLGDQALEDLPIKLDHWTPAGLSLLALGHPEQFEAMKVSPLHPLDQSLLDTADFEFRKWTESKTDGVSLAKAGFLALALRERYRLKSDWKVVLQVFSERPIAGETVLACLYGFLPDPFELLRNIGNLSLKSDNTDYLIHVLFANPLTDDAREGLLGALLSELPRETSTQIVQKVSLLRPWQVADLTQDLISRYEEVDSNSNEIQSGELYHLGSHLDQLADRARLAQTYYLATQPEVSVSILADMIKSIHRLRGHLSAQLAKAITQTKRQGNEDGHHSALETSLEAWKQAIKWVPEYDEYAAGLAETLVDIGNLSDAQDYLQAKGYAADSKQPPFILLTRALIADRLEDHEQVQQLADQAFSALKERPFMERVQYIALARLFDKYDMQQQLVRLTNLALQMFPTDCELLVLQA